jgi:hypothetical protein
MAKQQIEIGSQGNDGTGDSIREAFRKVNENFNELYAIFGAGGQIKFEDLSNVPSELFPTQILITNDLGNGTADTVEGRTLIAGDGIEINYSTTNNLPSLEIRSTAQNISADTSPVLGGPLNGSSFAIANIAAPSENAVAQYNALHQPQTPITQDSLVITKGYADKRYIKQTGGGAAAGQIRIREEPLNASSYTKTIASYTGGNIVVTAHGYDSGSDGIAFKYATTGTSASNLTPGTTYYLKYVDANQLGVYSTLAGAQEGNPTYRISAGSTSQGSGTQTLTDAFYDSTLSGYWLSNEALPRSSVVRRQGDTMDGTLYLDDHPGALAGAGTPNGADDLQAATKYYVDNSSFASQVNLFVTTTGDDKQTNTPPGKEGRAFAYAYSTIGAACQKAVDIIDVAANEPGPYRQKITYTIGNVTYTSLTQSVTFSGGTGYVGVQNTIAANREYIREETVGWIDTQIANGTPPFAKTFTYNRETCSRDVGYILDAIVLDILVAGNYQSINAGKSYFKNASALIASGPQGAETVAAINYAKYLTNQVLLGLAPAQSYQSIYTRKAVIGSVTSPMRTSVAACFDIITGIISNGIGSAPTRNFGAGYVLLTFSNGNVGYVDQGAPTNVDIISGKLVRGIYSGAVGKIKKFSNGASADSIECYLLTPYNFDTNEPLEFAEPNKNVQITIRVESGIYFEDFPIRIPNNVSVKGDEFRRTIIRPRDRASQAPLVGSYFYRDKFFDGLRLTAYVGASQATAVSVTPSKVSGTVVMTLGSGTVNTAWFGQFFKASQGAGLIPAEGVVSAVFMGAYSPTQLYSPGMVFSYLGVFYKAQAVVKGVTPPSSSFYITYSGAITTTNKFEVTLFKTFNNTSTISSGNWFIYNTSSYGYHYLQDPSRVMNVGPSYVNAGGYTKAAKLLEINRSYIQAEVTGYFSTNPSTSALWTSLGATGQANYSRDVGYIVDALISDLKEGGKASSVDAASRYYGGTGTVGVVNYIGTISSRISKNLTPTTTYQNTVTQVFNGVNGETNSDTAILNLISTVAFSFDVNYNPPKNNKEIDMFFMNDAVKIHNVTGQGHGGFMCVLDPNGIIGSKSPYVQSCSSLSASTNTQRFAGGMYIDGFVGRLPATITGTSNAGLTLSVTGLTKREPLGPTAFYRAGFRYQIDNVSSWDPITGNATLDLNPTTPWAGGNIDIILETPGNRSMLANDFTQVNDLGYGIVANNNGITEQVSTFTYYCHTAYYSANGGQIRSVAGSNAHGKYGLRASGADPTEAPDQVYLTNSMVQVGQVYKYSNFSNAGISSDTKFYLKRYSYIPTPTSELEVQSSTGPVRYEVKSTTVTGIFDNNYTTRVTGITQANPCVVTTIPSASITGITQASPAIVSSVGHPFQQGDLVYITGVLGMTAINGKTFYVGHVQANSFGLFRDAALTLPYSTSTFNVYSSGGTASSPNPFHSGDRVSFSSIGGMTQLNGNNYYVKPVTSNTFELYSDKALTTSINSSAYTAYTSGGTVTDQVTYSITAATKANPCVVTLSQAHNFNDGDIVTIAGVAGMTGINSNFYVKVTGLLSTQIALYKEANLVTTIDSSNYSTYTSGGTVVGGQEVILVNLSTAANDNRVSTGFSEDLFNDQNVIIRCLQNFRFYDIANVKPTRPSTALEFIDTIESQNGGELYRVIAYNLTESTGAALPDSVAILSTDTSFLYIRPLVLASAITTTDPIDPTKKMGSQIGDIRIAIDATSLNSDGLAAAASAKWEFAWSGKVHRIQSYTAAVGLVPAYITISDVQDNNTIPSGVTGIAQAFPTTSSITLRAGLPANSNGQITVRISTNRATGHDFLDIGTGGYNTTNYPYAIFGNPSQTATRENQVLEETKGRVFYVATDQDGIFTVGKFFKVDQGTGSVTFSASIALSNLDGLGFKRGVVVSEFSTDNTMTNNAADTVPTQSAIRGYIDRRLGLSHVGSNVSLTDLIGPGFLPLSGALAMKGNLQAGGNRITGLASPSDVSDATSKSYVDNLVDTNNQLSFLKDVAITSPTTASILAFTGNGNANIDVGVTGDISSSFTGLVTTTLLGSITTPPTPDAGILDGLQGTVANGIAVNSTTAFPASGFLLINGEIFSYGGKTDIAGTFDTVVRAKYTTTGTSHAAGSLVILLSSAQISLQINPGVIINADVNANAGIEQSKLLMNAASTRANATSIVQADRGLASFDSTYFSATDGWISLTNAGIGLGKLASIANGSVLANISGASASPSATTAGDVLKAGLDQAFNTSGVVTFTTGTPNTYAITPVSTSNSGNSIVKTDNSGQINVTSLRLNGNTIINYSGSNLNINTPGGFKIIDAVGATEAATNVILYGQYTLGAQSTFTASNATNATNATNADKLNVSGNFRSAAIAGTANTIAARDSGGGLTATTFYGDLSGTASATNYAVTSGIAGNATYSDFLKTTNSSSIALSSVSITGTSGQFTCLGTTLSVGQAITISGTAGGSGLITGYSNPTTYYVISTNGSSTFALSTTYKAASTVTLSGVTITGTAGQFSCSANTLAVGQPICITGPYGGTGSISGYNTGTIYYIIATNGSTTFTLSASYGGTAITTTAGTPTGITYTLTQTNVVPVTTVAGTPTGLTYTITQNTPNYRTATEAATDTTIAARTSTDYTDPGTGVTYTKGSIYATYFVGIATSALFADLAEFYLADKKYEPGTVLIFGGEREVTTTNLFGDTRVAGVVSTNPAYIMNSEIKGEGEKVAVALQGRVPCKVVGTVKKGDILTTSAIPGHACKAMDPKLGTIVGKALEDKTTSEAGVIEVSVGRT